MTKTYHLEHKDPGLRALLDTTFLQLRGKRLSRIRRSIGSCLLVDFGKLTSYTEGKRTHRRGEWSFLIEMSPWKITNGRRLLLDSDQMPAIIDRRLSKLLSGQKVENVSVKPRGDFEINLADGTKFSVRKRYSKKYNNNWCLFYKRDWSISNATEDDLYEIALNIDRERAITKRRRRLAS